MKLDILKIDFPEYEPQDIWELYKLAVGDISININGRIETYYDCSVLMVVNSIIYGVLPLLRNEKNVIDIGDFSGSTQFEIKTSDRNKFEFLDHIEENKEEIDFKELVILVELIYSDLKKILRNIESKLLNKNLRELELELKKIITVANTG